MPTLAEIRLRACKLWPYGSHAILSLVPVERPGLGTLAVDQHWRLYFDPRELAMQPLDESAGVVLHEVSHLLLKHHRRAARQLPVTADGAQWRRWNVAADYAINSMLRQEGIALWEGGLAPEQDGFPPGLSAEDYFRRLSDKAEKQAHEEPDATAAPTEDSDNAASDAQGGGTCDDSSGAEGHDTSDSQGDESAGDADDAESADDGDDGDGGSGGAPDDCESDGEGSGGEGGDGDANGDGHGEPGDDATSTGEGSGTPTGGVNSAGPATKPGAGDGGSCADGRQRPWELAAPADCDTPGLAPHEADILVAETAKRIAEKSRGTGGGAWQRWAEQVLNPRIDPRTALLRHVRAAVEQTTGLGDYSFRRPNRRNPRADMLLPTAVQPLPRITVLVDTSGSMDQRDLGLCLGLIGKVLKSFRIRDGIRVVTGDVRAVTAAQVFDPRQVELVGGGGTDMGALIRATATGRPRPQLIVVASDGFTPWCEPVAVPVVACLTRKERREFVPAWIKTIVLDATDVGAV